MNPFLPWYIAGPLIGLIVPLLLIFKEKQFGVSSSLRAIVSFVLPHVEYFNYSRKSDYWQVFFAIGLILAGWVLPDFFAPESNNITTSEYGTIAEHIYSIDNWIVFAIGGFAIGFGARYAGGCTAGHCIMGNALLAKSAMISTISFFVGGLITSHFIIPNLF